MFKNIIFFDTFGETPFLRIQNRKSFKTITGACLTIILYNVISIFSVFTLLEYYNTNKSALQVIKEEPNLQNLDPFIPLQTDFTIAFNILNNSNSFKFNDVLKVKSRDEMYTLHECSTVVDNEMRFCVKFNKTFPESLDFTLNLSESNAKDWLSTNLINMELMYYRPELNNLNKEKYLVIKNFFLNLSYHTNLYVKLKKINVYSKRPFQSIKSFSDTGFHTLKYYKTQKQETIVHNSIVILTIEFDTLEYSQNIYKFCENLDLIIYKIIFNSVCIYYILGHLSMILTKNSSFIYLTNKYFRFSNEVEENKQFLLKFYKDKQQFQKINIPSQHRDSIQNNRIPFNSQNIDSKCTPHSENNSLMQSSLNNSINYECSKICLKENPCKIKSFASKISSRPESTQKDDIESVFKEKRNMWRMTDNEIYISRLFGFKVRLGLCSRLRCRRIKQTDYDEKNFNYSLNILKNFLSVETLIKVISDVEKLKDLVMNKAQKTIFDFYYLNNYSKIDPAKEIESYFDKKEFISFWKLRPNDEFSRNINSRLLDLFNEDILKCFCNTD